MRLKKILPGLIHVNQSVFVPGRQITDNALLAFELFHMMKNNKAKKGIFSLELDMAKAYDRVEWHFSSATMIRMGFHVGFVNLVMRCVSTVNFSILINGSPGKTFTPTRGLRQGILSLRISFYFVQTLSRRCFVVQREIISYMEPGCVEQPLLSRIFSLPMTV